MIRRLKITLLVVLCSLAGAAAYIVWPRTVPFSECSELYQRYADNEHVAASFVRNYRVNDTLTLDVTLLQATDSAGWQQMLEDFEIIIDESVVEATAKGRDIIASAVRPIPEKAKDDSERYVLGASEYSKTICIYHTHSKEQRLAVISHNTKSGNNKQQKSNP